MSHYCSRTFIQLAHYCSRIPLYNSPLLHTYLCTSDSLLWLITTLVPLFNCPIITLNTLVPLYNCPSITLVPLHNWPIYLFIKKITTLVPLFNCPIITLHTLVPLYNWPIITPVPLYNCSIIALLPYLYNWPILLLRHLCSTDPLGTSLLLPEQTPGGV